LRIGKEKGSKEVKGHADHMISDHKQLGDDVAAYISKKNLTLEGVDTADTDNDLAEKAAGKDFDKAWADKMVSDHEKVIDMFEDAQDDVKDPELKTMITNAIPKLKSHLDMAKQLQEKLDNAKK
jgi:putative membrane protein